MTTQQITCAGEQLILLPERAIFWRREATLFVADLHLGKDATFRSAGLALPIGVVERDLARLSQIVLSTQAKRLVILGDFFHARPGRTADTLAAINAWRQRHSTLLITLVRGNHDRHAGEPLGEWQIELSGDQLILPPFLCQHEPLTVSELSQHMAADGYILAGHLHPMVVLSEAGGAGLRLPCFYFGKQQAILPAFGVFTGGYTLRRSAMDRIFVITPQGVCAI